MLDSIIRTFLPAVNRFFHPREKKRPAPDGAGHEKGGAMQRRETQRTESALGKEIAEKRRLLYERHGGIMSPVDVAREMGYYPSSSRGDRWAQEHDVPAVRLGARKRGYETDLVAKAIVQSRGMV